MVSVKPREVQTINKINNILVVGGDRRQLYMADYLEKSGFDVSLYSLPEGKGRRVQNLKTAVSEAQGIILPLPVTRDGKYLFSSVPPKESFDEISAMITENHIVFGGMLNRSLKARLEKNGGKAYDYFEREDVTVMNAVPTVQGILKTMLENIDYTVHSSRCAVFGYGRLAKVAARTLAAMGADITVCVRKQSDIALARVNGCEGCFINDFHKIADKFDVIINTVPAPVINRGILENVRADCLIIDVASAPYGTDFAAANELGIRALQCSSLPGKTAPKTAGKIIAEGIINILEEREYE